MKIIMLKQNTGFKNGKLNNNVYFIVVNLTMFFLSINNQI